MAPEGLWNVATGEAASGATDDAKPVVDVRFPYSIAPGERRILECRVRNPNFNSLCLLREGPYTLVHTSTSGNSSAPPGQT